ncbi:diacylglycerol acyltransferase [Trypanosoma cruzi]|uniref:Acyltransferase n=1 Tax=Trypanosoma cruzi TaxID=5693 RepID=A0A7J6YEW9_TRYCR|nr:diacylglycerol acyltransferase [Trypanosoma cruzi]
MEFGEGTAMAADHHDSQAAFPLAEEYVVEPTTTEEMHELLDMIVSACDHLQGLIRDRLPVTQREVSKLRKAYWLATGETERLRSRSGSRSSIFGNADCGGAGIQPLHPGVEGRRRQDGKILACDCALRQLEEYVGPRPEAHTFDQDDDAGNEGERSRMRRFFCVPVERRLQTLLVSAFLFFTLIPVSLALTVALLLNWWTMPFMVAYLVHIFTFGQPRHPLRKNTAFTRLKIWRHYGAYFPVRLVIPCRVREKFEPQKNYFFVYHPHGIHGFGAIANFTLDATVSSLLPGIIIHAQTLKLNFYIPFWRELQRLCGNGDASEGCIRRTLRSGPGESVLLVVGGARESLLASPRTNELSLQSRRGFVRIALQEGSPLVPVYAFGENDVYRIPRAAGSRWWRRVNAILRKVLSFGFPLFVGRGWFNYCFGVLPHRRPIYVVVGEPLPVPKIPQPTPGDLQEWHDKYVAALKRLFDGYRAVYDVESSGLRIH